jgi:tetratricopeptide (TPR) repeat protein
MKNAIFPILALTLAFQAATAQQITLTGQVSIHNSRHHTGKIEYVKEATVSSPFTETIETDNEGKFTLKFNDTIAGKTIRIKIEKAGYEVVNKEDLLGTVIERKVPLRVYLAPIGNIEQVEAELNHINLQSLTDRYNRMIAGLRQEGEERQAAISELEQQLKRPISNHIEAEELLTKHIQSLKSRLPEVTKELASLNLDFASEKHLLMYEFFKSGETEKTIEMLRPFNVEGIKYYTNVEKFFRPPQLGMLGLEPSIEKRIEGRLKQNQKELKQNQKELKQNHRKSKRNHHRFDVILPVREHFLNMNKERLEQKQRILELTLEMVKLDAYYANNIYSLGRLLGRGTWRQNFQVYLRHTMPDSLGRLLGRGTWREYNIDAQIALMLNDYDQAETSFYESLEGIKLNRKLHFIGRDTQEYASILGNLALIFESKGLLEMAEKTRKKAQSSKPKDCISEFPWPPPKASARYEIPNSFFESVKTLGDIKNMLSEALDQCGYFERSYYCVIPDGGGTGFALVARIEQIDQEAFPLPLPDRWSMEIRPLSSFSLKEIVKSFFFKKPGYFRIVAFVVYDEPFKQSAKGLTRDAGISLLHNGANRLSSDIAATRFSEKFSCTALIYEFEAPESGRETKQVTSSKHTGRVHLERAKLLDALQAKK